MDRLKLAYQFWGILPRHQRVVYGLVAGWILAMIFVPILRWTFGDAIIPPAITFALMIQCAAVFVALASVWGLPRIRGVFLIVAVMTWGVEFLGSKTNFPFGSYDYTPLLQPQLGGVPLLIPLAWFMMLPVAWNIAHLTVGTKNPLVYIIISAFAMTAWDLFLDPQMVMWKFWEWHEYGAYFGIPIVNYIGWLLTAGIITAVIRPYRWEMPRYPLWVVYAVVWFLQSIGLAVFWSMAGPAFFGCISMGAFLMWSWRGLRGHHEH
ncbi:MAG: carotenoid biosynthesis protein [bacterium]|nr:carotenoid biosynthesis protein [bacterium]